MDLQLQGKDALVTGSSRALLLTQGEPPQAKVFFYGGFCAW